MLLHVRGQRLVRHDARHRLRPPQLLLNHDFLLDVEDLLFAQNFPHLRIFTLLGPNENLILFLTQLKRLDAHGLVFDERLELLHLCALLPRILQVLLGHAQLLRQLLILTAERVYFPLFIR